MTTGGHDRDGHPKDVPSGLQLEVPGHKPLVLSHLLLDFNGTLARDGVLLPGVKPRLARLARRLAIYVVTADTFGTAAAVLAGLPLELVRLEGARQGAAKRRCIETLGAHHVVAIGNGHNDVEMLHAAALGIVVVGPEGAWRGTLVAADVVVTRPVEALDLLLQPKRLLATLRS